MGGFFGAITKQDCVLDVFFGTDYHSHLGTKRGGMAVYDRKDGFQRQIHNIENTPFRTKFDKDLAEFHGCSGIGCISDTDPQPLLVRSHLGLYAITTVGIINNADALVERYFSDHGHQFMAMSSGKVNATELVAALINQKDDLISGIRHAQDEIDGSATILILDADGILAARDKLAACRCSSARAKTAAASPSSPSPTISWATMTPTSWAPGRSYGSRPAAGRPSPPPESR